VAPEKNFEAWWSFLFGVVEALALTHLGMKFVRQARQKFGCHLGNAMNLQSVYEASI